MKKPHPCVSAKNQQLLACSFLYTGTWFSPFFIHFISKGCKLMMSLITDQVTAHRWNLPFFPPVDSSYTAKPFPVMKTEFCVKIFKQRIMIIAEVMISMLHKEIYYDVHVTSKFHFISKGHCTQVEFAIFPSGCGYTAHSKTLVLRGYLKVKNART